MKKILAIVVVVALVAVLAACGNGGDTTSPDGTTQVRVASIFAGPVNDGSFNETQLNGLRRMEGRGAHVSYAENIGDTDAAEAMRAFAVEGYDVVILSTNAYQDLVFPLTGDFPDTKFVQFNGTHMTDNFFSLRVANEELGFLAGIVAALWSETGYVGFVGGQDITPIIAGSLGFQQGVDYVNEHFGRNVTAIRINTGNFLDANQAKETAISMIESGVDVLVPLADAAGIGVIEAAEERGVMAVGTGPGHVRNAPNNVLATIVRDNAYVYDAIWQWIDNNDWPTEILPHGAAAGVIYATDWLSGIDPEVIELTDLVLGRMISGEIQVDR
jgi:basic membrane protein A